MKPATMILAAVALSLAAIGPSAIRAAEKPLNPKAIAIKLPDQIPWVRNAAGTAEVAILYGDPDKPGLYAVMQKWLPGNMSRPHWHPNDRFITVLEGTWWVGTGEPFDPATTTPVPVGSVVTHFGKEIHYDGAKEAATVLLIVGEGPATNTPASTPPPAH
jgi:hypothetical protein